MIGSIKNYLLVTKPGIIAGNLVSVAGGFFLASICESGQQHTPNQKIVVLALDHRTGNTGYFQIEIK
jgi:heme O synthase-like polyprenyltransferase